MIENAEESAGLRLTGAARRMLALPVEEQYFDGRQPIDWAEVEQSIRLLIKTVREDESISSLSRRGDRNAVSVIRAFFKNFCNIPPFCSPTDGDRGFRG
jgi:hypothetical protein